MGRDGRGERFYYDAKLSYLSVTADVLKYFK